MIKFIKRGEVSKKTNFIVRIMAIILALIVAGIFMAILGHNPIEVYGYMIKGAFGSPGKIRQTIILVIPLLITGLGVSVAFKMQYWNIGGEGQILMGAFGAALFALNFPSLPMPLLLILMIISGAIFGGLWALISGVLKVYFNTNETITTLMLNYVALKIITYLQYDAWKDKQALGFPKIANFPDNAIFPSVFRVHIGWIIALVLVVIFYVSMKHSKMGYEISVLGESKNTAKYAGINIKKTILKAVFISGAVCGLTGVIQSSAVSNTLSVEVTGGMGYTAIIVAWLSNLSALIMLIVSVLFAALLEGGAYIQTAFGIPNAAASVMQALILFFVLGSEFFVKYKLVFANKLTKSNSGKASKIESKDEVI